MNKGLERVKGIEPSFSVQWVFVGVYLCEYRENGSPFDLIYCTPCTI